MVIQIIVLMQTEEATSLTLFWFLSEKTIYSKSKEDVSFGIGS